MQMLLQSDEWSCLPTSFAMLTDVLPKDIYEYIGHDGSEIIWPELFDPYRRRSFSIDEMLDWCICTACYPVTISFDASYCPAEGEEDFDPYGGEGDLRIKHYLDSADAVLIGHGKRSGKPHAVAWCHKEQLVYDPYGFKYVITDFEAHTGFFKFS